MLIFLPLLMSRKLISSLLLLTLLLQGWAQAGIAVMYEQQVPQHCDAQASPADDCPCCPDGMPMSVGCESQCSVAMAIAITPRSFAAPTAPRAQRLVVPDRPGPNYLPLNPPPIS